MFALLAADLEAIQRNPIPELKRLQASTAKMDRVLYDLLLHHGAPGTIMSAESDVTRLIGRKTFCALQETLVRLEGMGRGALPSSNADPAAALEAFLTYYDRVAARSRGRAPRVVMVTKYFRPTLEGAGRQAETLGRLLKSHGTEVQVVTRRLPGLPARDDEDGLPVQRLGFPLRSEGPLNTVVYMTSLFSHLLRAAGSYDVIHVHLANGSSLPAVLAGRLLGKPVIIKVGGVNGSEFKGHAQSALGRIYNRILRRLSPQFVTISQALFNETVEHMGPERVRLIPNGVDTELFRRINPGDGKSDSRKALRSKFGWPRDSMGFIYTGRFAPVKNLPFFLDAWTTAVAQAGVPAFIAFVGGGEEEGRIRAIAEGHGSRDKVFIHPVADDVSGYLRAADVFVMPSTSEGLSSAILEAMATGLPILATRNGGPPDAVIEDENGLLFDPHNRTEIIKCVRRMLTGQVHLARMGAVSRKRAQEIFSMDRILGLYRGLYVHSMMAAGPVADQTAAALR